MHLPIARPGRGGSRISRRLLLAALAWSIVLGHASTALAAVDSNGCTFYASPGGSDRNTGRTSDEPQTLQRVLRRPVAGDHVCLLRGTYPLDKTLYLAHSGAPGAPIVYRSFGGRATLQRVPGGAS